MKDGKTIAKAHVALSLIWIHLRKEQILQFGLYVFLDYVKSHEAVISI